METITNKNTLKSWFRRGLKPLEAQFGAWMDSYWHKSETIPTSSIEGLETTLNSKAESSALDALADNLATHFTDDTRHKTPGEQNKLDHLADNPDATYATKAEITAEYEPIVFTGTYTVLNAALEDRKYTLDTGQASKFTSYFIQAKTNPVILQFSLAGEPAAPEQEIFLLNKTFTNGARYDLEFISLRSGKLKKIMLRMTKSSGGIWGSNITLTASEYAFGESEYKYDRYYYLDGGFDMDKFTESGGIAAAVYEASEGFEAAVGQNIPPGFTEFYGYVLANDGGNRDKCCTQVVTDRDLQKTMMRSSIRSSTLKNTWTEWKEIGGAEMNPIITLNATLNVTTNAINVTNPEAVAEYAAAKDSGKNPQIVLNIAGVVYYPQMAVYTGTGFAITYPSVAIANNGMVTICDMSLMFLKSGDTWTLTPSTMKTVAVNPPDYLKVSNIHVVAEYPADLEAYPEGAIFIKQPQA